MHRILSYIDHSIDYILGTLCTITLPYHCEVKLLVFYYYYMLCKSVEKCKLNGDKLVSNMPTEAPQ